jgi:hypothetical protein
MPSTIVLNQNNVLNDGNNNILEYNFPSSVVFNNHQIAVASVSMYYSWQNINASPLANNTFTYSWTVTGTTTTYTVTIPDGLYEVSDINNFFQYTMIANGHYLINAAGQNVYYAEFIVNPTLYACQINTFLVPTSLPSGFTAPSGYAGYPTTTKTPVVTMTSNLGAILGFSNTFATTNSTSADQSANSTLTPQVQPNSNLLFSMSNIDNKYSNPSSIIFSIAPSVAIGQQINERPPNYAWNRLLPGTYNKLRLQLLGTDLQTIKILDKNMTILLVIQDIFEKS